MPTTTGVMSLAIAYYVRDRVPQAAPQESTPLCPLKGGKHHGALDRCDDLVRAGGGLAAAGAGLLVKPSTGPSPASAMLEHVRPPGGRHPGGGSGRNPNAS